MNTATTTAAASLTAKVQRNNIGTQGVIDSGGKQAIGIRVSLQGQSVNSVTVDQNNVREVPNGFGIRVLGRTGTGSSKVKVTNNVMPRPTETDFDVGCGGGATPCPTNTVSFEALNGYDLCTTVSANTAYDPESWPQGGGANAYFLLGQTGAGSVLNLEGTNPSATTQIANTNTVTNSSGGTPDVFTSGVTVVAPNSCGGFP